jgi:hypothetical protein
MKAKLKGANGFVRFLLQHGEKIGIAAILVVAGMLVWSSLGRPIVDDSKQPPALTREANAAKSSVENMSWETFPPEERTDFTSFSSRSGDLVSTPVNPRSYPPIPPWDQPVIKPIKLREDPILVAATDLEVRASAGLWMSSDAEAIRANMRAAAQEAARLRREQEEEAARMAEEGDREGGRGRGQGRGRGEGGFGEMGRGGMGSDMGGMKTKDGALVMQPMGGAQVQGFEKIMEQSWVTVLAKVPIKQQFQMYEDALASARGFNVTADQPEYLGYEVERAEVTDDGPGKFTLLKRVSAKAMIDRMSTWPIQTPDLVNPKYIHPLLTHPLPPMIMREWGDEITHSDLPLPTPEELAAGPGMEEVQPEEPAESGDESEDPFGRAARRAAQPGMAMGRGAEMGMMGRPGMGRGGEMGMMGRPGMGRGGEMGMMGRPGMGRGGEMGGMGMGASIVEELPPFAWDGRTKTLLFRYFDDTVEPGRRYRYRVQLVLKDVNANQPAMYLDPEVSTRQTEDKRPYRVTEWSEPSPVAVVPRPGLTFIAETKDPGGAEPEARLIIKSVDSANAAEVANDAWYTRGSVLNFTQKAKIIWSSVYKVNAEKPDESPVFRFFTGLTLIDLDGGDQLVPKNRNLKAPARALVMDSAGRLMMQNELDQGKTIREYDFILRQDAEAARRARETESDRGGRGGGRGGGGRGGF